MKINMKAKSVSMMFKDPADTVLCDVQRLERLSGKRPATLSDEDINRLIARGATATLEASVGAGRTSTFTRVALLGVDGLGSKKIKGDIFVVIKVNDAPVEEVTVKAKYEKDLREWALAFNKASAGNAPEVVPAPAVTSTADVLGQLGQLHDGGLLSDDEFASKRAEVIGRI